MTFQPVLLWSDALIWLLVLAGIAFGAVIRRSPPLLHAWQRVGNNRIGMASATLLLAFVLVGLLDSLHYRPALPDSPVATGNSSGNTSGKPETRYAVEVLSVLDTLLTPLRSRNEKTYSAPLATHLYARETLTLPEGGTVRDFPPLKQAAQHPGAGESGDYLWRAGQGSLLALLLWSMTTVLILLRQPGPDWASRWQQLWHRPAGEAGTAWDAVLLTLGFLLLMLLPLAFLAQGYHAFGTDKVGQDVLYQVLKSIRTALVIGLITTLVTLPIAILLGILAGYFGGWVDDVIQYVYTVLNSIPGVLLIAAAVLMMQVVIDTHPQWFATAAERADLRLLALCFILGMTSWTGLARLLRGETLKLRTLDYIQAAQAFGVSSGRILLRHIVPNLMHIIIIALVMDFSGLVLAEAVLSYVGIGVDPTMTSFGTMINNARMELSREPAVWWTLAAAFVTMFLLVLAANLFADAVRDAFDPRTA